MPLHVQLLEIGHLFNLIGAGLMLALSGAIGYRYPAPFFRAWVVGFGFFFLLLAGEFVSMAGRSLALNAAETVFLGGAFWCFWQTGRILRGARPLGPRGHATTAAFILTSIALMAAGVPFELALMPMAIGNACAMIRLGLVFLRELKPEDAASSAKWVGGSAVALALWPFIFPYPLLVHTSLAWFGYAGSGLLQIVWGTGMALYLIEVSWLRYQRAQEQIAQVKNDIVSIVSHELRSPLTAAIGYAEFLDEELAGPLNEAQREYLAEIQKGHRRLRRLVDDLLDFSLAESRALKLDRREADLGDLVQAVVESFRLQAQRAGVRLELERPTEPLRAQVDPERIEQVITNLVGNALKFTPEGGAVRVAIRAEGPQRIVEVSDDGMGIDPADLPHLFDKFFQAHGGPRRVRGGAGLGLAVAKAIVEAHGGGIAVASDPGEGTCFAVALPAEMPSASALQPEADCEAMTS